MKWFIISTDIEFYDQRKYYTWCWINIITLTPFFLSISTVLPPSPRLRPVNLSTTLPSNHCDVILDIHCLAISTPKSNSWLPYTATSTYEREQECHVKQIKLVRQIWCDQTFTCLCLLIKTTPVYQAQIQGWNLLNTLKN